MRSSSTFVTASLLASIAVAAAAAPYGSQLYARGAEDAVAKDAARIGRLETTRKKDKAQESVLANQIVNSAKAGNTAAVKSEKSKLNTVEQQDARATKKEKKVEKDLRRQARRPRTRRQLYARGPDDVAKDAARIGRLENIRKGTKAEESVLANQIVNSAKAGNTAAVKAEESTLKGIEQKETRVTKKEALVETKLRKDAQNQRRSDLGDLLLEARAHRLHARDLEDEYLEARQLEDSEILARGFWDGINQLD
ncbi:hypothetical protein C8J56DRAFT_1061042 [Mycena floridula]|nr:hypothetical protein C8J56DRAFT_1061042 [Mycena floridula]